MGKKYIIELEDSESVYKTIIANGYPMLQVIVPAPCTEPDIEKVREEAFKNGYDAACKDIDIKSKTNAAYRKGLEDAWECARKIALTEGLGIDGMYAVFGTEDPEPIFREYSVNECIKSVRRYEQEKDKQARIEYNSDEIKDVINTTMKECNVSLDDIAEVLQKMKENSDG